MINERQLECILAVHETGNFTKAADQLHVSQPALSQMIRIIENEIGSELFNRKQNPIKLTYEGEIYLKTCLEMNQLHRNTLRKLSEIREDKSGRIIIGLTLHMSIFLAHKIVPRFLRQFPGFEIQLVEAPMTTLIEKTRTGQIDVALVYREEEADLFYRDIIKEEVFLLTPGTYKRPVSDHPVDLRELKDEPFVLMKKGHSLRSLADRLFLANGINPPVKMETDSIETARRLTEAGMGFTFVPTISFQTGSNGKDRENSWPIARYDSDRYIKACMKKSTWEREKVRRLVKIITDVLKGW
ncbi:MAG: LysR family transcriptional regulator [Sphaerochaetaceae bacterium]|nr:LysR family transcriptional regulator [Sphaerochaetaceae bacterium]